MYRWNTKLDHLLDNLANGFQVTERWIRLSPGTSSRISNVGRWASLFDAKNMRWHGPQRCLEVRWTGTSFTSSGHTEFAGGSLGLFGKYGVQVTQSWCDRHQPTVTKYLADNDPTWDSLIKEIAESNLDRTVVSMLAGIDRDDLAHEAEIRVFSEGRIPIGLNSDVVEVFVPSDPCRQRIIAMLSPTFPVTVLPSDLPLRELPSNLWD